MIFKPRDIKTDVCVSVNGVINSLIKYFIELKLKKKKHDPVRKPQTMFVILTGSF